MAKTLCPSCGHSPIPAGAGACPVCQEPFAFLQTHKKAKNRFIDKRDSEEMEGTVFGGALTGEVSAHPGPAAAVFFAGAAIWFVRVAGILGDFADPQWVYAVVAADLIGALLILVNLGPAKVMAQLLMLAQLGVALFLSRNALLSPVHLLYAAHALIGLMLVSGEPGAVRRNIGLLAGLLCAAGAVVLQVATPGFGPQVTRQELHARQAGFRVLLPEGYVQAQPAELQAHLRVPPATPTTTSAGFASASDRTVGLVLVRRDPSLQAIGGCQTLHQDLGGTNVATPVSHRAPSALGEAPVVYELRTFSGATGLLACGKLDDGRFAALAVLSVNPDAQAGAKAFDQVGAGLSLK